MNTPIVDFISDYQNKNGIRFHMPGHKGMSFLGLEGLDLTEIRGADELYHPDGIIAQSEKNATVLFGTGMTAYSTEGSSQCIRAMLTLAVSDSKERPCILAARNVHKAFIYSAALLDFDVEWLYPSKSDSLCSCVITAKDLHKKLNSVERKVHAVYITSPDYLGNIADIAGLAKVCQQHHVLLLVDNAHGAYLHFLEKPLHPIDLGADICCDSAHKTLPALTGAAYLHVHKRNAGRWDVKKAMEMFGSTSPSYLTLQSLDLVNAYLCSGYKERLSNMISLVRECKKALIQQNWTLLNDDPLRITLDSARSGWDGNDLADYLRKGNMECEYADPDYVVLMVTPETDPSHLDALVKWLGNNMRTPGIEYSFPTLVPKQIVPIRQALFSKSYRIPVDNAVGRICGAPTVSCPPAIPVVVSGEIIDQTAVNVLKHYKIDEIDVLA